MLLSCKNTIIGVTEFKKVFLKTFKINYEIFQDSRKV